MSYLLRVELPDVPGSLGRLASAIGASGATSTRSRSSDATPPPVWRSTTSSSLLMPR